MVGFLGAIAGGAMKGWSQGTLDEIKAKREEKLHLLDQQFTHTENELTRAATERQTAAELASRERLTGATLGVQERLGELQSATQKSIAELGSKTSITTTGMQTGSEKERTQMQIDAGKDLAKMQLDAARLSGSKFVTQADGSSVLVDGYGNPVPMPNDPKTGKPMNPATTDTDTPEMKNFKFMKTLGISDTEAMQVFTSKNADPALLYTSLVETFTKAQTTFGVANDKVAENSDRWARTMLANMGKSLPAGTAPGATPAPAAGTPDQAAPAVPSSAGATAPARPENVTDEVLIKQAVEGVKNGTLTKEAAAARLKSWNIDPTKAGL